MKKLLLVAALLTLAGCSKVNKENYDKIKVGMDNTEVEAIIGSADSCEEKTLHTNCVWGSEEEKITITFVTNKVTLFSSKGLK